MIRSFRDKATAELYQGDRPRRVPPDVAKAARRKLGMLNSASILADLRVPPRNHLERLKGDLARCHSIRVNDLWRIVFRWEPDGPHEVWFTDYH